MERVDEMSHIEDRIRSCQKCELWKSRTNTVPGEGSFSADIMFIGEAPGFHEDKQGRPFVGRAGKILDEMLATVSLNRDDVFIANILKCRPPKNRNPEKEEILSCTKYLNHQIDVIQPLIFVPLGNFACKFLFEKFSLPYTKISKVHGKIFTTTTLMGKRFIIPMYHPAVATYNPNKKSLLIEDMKAIQEVMEDPAVKS